MDITKAQFWNAPNEQGLPTFSFDDLVAALAGAGVTGNIGKGASIISGADQDFVNQNFTVLDFLAGATVDYDDLGFWVPGSDTENFIIPADVSRVKLWCVGEWATDIVGRRLIRTRLNGSATPTVAAQAAWNTVPPPIGPASFTLNSGVFAVIEGDEIGFGGSQTSGGNLDLLNFAMGIVVIR